MFKPSHTVATPRAVLIGLSLAILINIFCLYGAYHIGYDHLTFAHLDIGILIPFLVGVFVPNIVLRSLRPSWALKSGELLFVFCLGWIGFMVPTWGMSNYFVNMMVTAEYYASPENRWREVFFPYLPEWSIVSDADGAVGDFYRGIPDHQPLPWRSWVVPVFWWLSLFAALLSVGICFVVLLRRQWVDHERLSYPLAQIPVLLTEFEQNQASPWPRFMRSRAFVIGFTVSLAMMLWNIIGYWSGWGDFPIGPGNDFVINFGPNIPTQVLRFNVISFTMSFFMNVDVLFSIWFFQVFSTLENAILNRIGVAASSGTAVPGGLVAVQFIGGMIIFVLVGLWMARRHLKEVWRHIGGNRTTLQDRDELLPYRTAVIVGAIGLCYAVFWLHASGMSFPVISVLLVLVFIFYLALCRVLAETGLVMVDLPINAHQFTVGMLGSSSLSPRNLTALGLGSGFARNWKTFTMIAPAHVARLKILMQIEGRTLFLWCAVAFGISVVTAVWYTAYSGYRFGGAANFYKNVAGDPGFYGLIVSWINNTTSITTAEVSFLLSGGAITAAIMGARYFLPWWPLSPVGFVVAAGGSVRTAFLPIFLAWLLKIILIRAGGVRLYRNSQPLILGILIGHIVGAAVSIMVDILWFPGSAHEVQLF